MQTQLDHVNIRQQAVSFYDAHVVEKIEDFVHGNRRVDCAWETICQCAIKPHRILEIGCGIGHVAWRMKAHWPESVVVGADISPASVDIATKLFASAGLSFCTWPPEAEAGWTEEFDLIVLMDVYEHIPPAERQPLHNWLRQLRKPTGRIVLSCPTPRYLARLRRDSPQAIQPVDEDIDLEVVHRLARETGTDVLLYKEVSVWHQGDYAHIALGAYDSWDLPAARGETPNKLSRLFRSRQRRHAQRQRRSLAKQRLGQEYSVALASV